MAQYKMNELISLVGELEVEEIDNARRNLWIKTFLAIK